MYQGFGATEQLNSHKASSHQPAYSQSKTSRFHRTTMVALMLTAHAAPVRVLAASAGLRPRVVVAAAALPRRAVITRAVEDEVPPRATQCSIARFPSTCSDNGHSCLRWERRQPCLAQDGVCWAVCEIAGRCMHPTCTRAHACCQCPSELTYVRLLQAASIVEQVVQEASTPNLPPPSPSTPTVASPVPSSNPTFTE